VAANYFKANSSIIIKYARLRYIYNSKGLLLLEELLSKKSD